MLLPSIQDLCKIMSHVVTELAVIIQWESYLFCFLVSRSCLFSSGCVKSEHSRFTNVLFLHLCVSLLQSEYMGSKLPKGTTKVLCVHFGVRYLCTIYMYKHLYFSCGNVDIYDNVNIKAAGAREIDLRTG